MRNTISDDGEFYTDEYGIQRLREMSTVGKIDNGKYKIVVWRETLGNPSFHFRKKDEYEVVYQIPDFKILEWKFCKLSERRVPSADFKVLINFLKSIRKGELTYWQDLLRLWNANNEDYEIDEDMDMQL